MNQLSHLQIWDTQLLSTWCTGQLEQGGKRGEGWLGEHFLEPEAKEVHVGLTVAYICFYLSSSLPHPTSYPYVLTNDTDIL